VKKFGGVPALAGTWETVSNKGESGETKQIIILNKDGTREDTVYINGEKVVESKSKWIAENNLLYMLQDDVEFVWKVTFEIKGRTLKITPGNTNLPEVEYIKK
jgi:hypothetical protein